MVWRLTAFITQTTCLSKGTLHEDKNGHQRKIFIDPESLLEFLVLKIIAADQVYAADILSQLSATEFATQEGTLYPLLSKMRREELVDYEWKESEAGPPRKYYQLTAKGREQLRETAEYWQKISGVVRSLGQKS